VGGPLVGEFFHVLGKLEEPGFQGLLAGFEPVQGGFSDEGFFLELEEEVFQEGKFGFDPFQPGYYVLWVHFFYYKLFLARGTVGNL
jgi:hypothetical protein